MPEFDPLIPQEIGGFSDQDWWDPSCLFDTPFLADGNTAAQPLPPVLDHVYSTKSTMPDSDPPTTNQEEYFLTDQDWWHVYDVPTEPRFDTPPTDHRINTVHKSESTIPTTTQEGYSMTDQEWCDFRLEGAIDGYDELDCAFIDLLERMAAPIRKISSTAPASPESEEAVATAKPGKKRNRWTHGEHKLFLEGLKVYGDGDWINISRDYVKTRTNIQIASHAQKHYLRQRLNESRITEKKRKSIHDVTTE